MLHHIVGAQRSIRPDFDILDSYVEKEMSACRIPGFALSVIKNGQTLYTKGYGIADPSGRLVTPDTPFHIASLSKSLTALAIMQLVDQDLVELDQKVSAYLPYFTLQDSSSMESVTIRQLLNHTSTLVENAEFAVASLRGDDTSVQELARRLASSRTSGVPGKTFQYNNANYIILGAVMEVVAGMSYQEYIRHNIFEPLGMHHSHLSLESALKDGLAAGYRTVFGFPVAVQLPFRTDFLPAYSIISSAADLSIYVGMLQNEGVHQGKRIVSAENLKMMFSLSSSVTPWEWYGFGWFLTSGSIYHGGELTNYQSRIKMLTDDGLAVVMLCNTSSSTVGTLFNVSYRDRIEGGIFNILYGLAPDHYPPGTGVFNLNRYPIKVSYTLYAALSIYIVYRLTTEILGLNQYQRSLSQRKRRLRKSLVSLLFWHFTLPAGVLLLIPLSTEASWVFIIFYIPDLGILAMTSCLALLGSGIFKLVAFIRHVRNISASGS
jgi:CubicO group peptidase (beta-lactamase class C family)